MQTLLLQGGTSINWLAILGPSLISALAVILVQILLATWLSKKTEGHKAELTKEVESYKKDISKELETHRIKLQSEFQTGFYQFQTKFSLLHQKRAEAIEKLFGLLARVENNVTTLATWEALSLSGDKSVFYDTTLKDFQDLKEFNLQKRIYFDREVVEEIKTLLQTLSPLLYGKDKECLRTSAQGLGKEKAAAARSIQDITRPLMVRLEEKFKTFLSAETPNNQLGKNH